MKIFLAASLALHAALLLPLLSRTSPPPPTASAPTEIVVSEVPREAGKTAGRGPRGPSGLSLKHLLKTDPRGRGTPGTARIQGNGDFDTGEIARNWTLAQELGTKSWLQAVWERVDWHVDYPQDFIDQNLEGTVSLQVQLDEKGRRVGGFRRIQGGERHLRAYVLATLARAFQEALPERLWAKQGMAISVHFDFRTTPQTVPVGKSRGDFRANQMRFHRLAYALPKFDRAVQKFRRKYVPPILPLPGGFLIDFVRVYEIVENWGKEDPDDLRAERVEMMTRLWEKRSESEL